MRLLLRSAAWGGIALSLRDGKTLISQGEGATGFGVIEPACQAVFRWESNGCCVAKCVLVTQQLD